MVTGEERFWAKVDKAGADDCWMWTASTSHRGYGKMYWNGKLEGAHRISYMLEHDIEELPKTLNDSRAEVMHTCDVPACVNPRHLVFGSTLLNQRDKAAKGRHHMQARKTCEYGHKWTKSNTGRVKGHYAKDGTEYKVRYCRQCHSERMKKVYWSKQKEERQSPEYKERKNARRRELYAQKHPNAKLRGTYGVRESK